MGVGWGGGHVATITASYKSYNRNEYRKIYGVKARKADNLTAIDKPIV
jgi:hypothetical protein